MLSRDGSDNRDPELGPWSVSVLQRLKAMHAYVQDRARQAQMADTENPRGVLIEPFAKFPAREFNYLKELATVDVELPATEADLLDEVAGFFRGGQRPESPYCLFNMNVLASVDATAAACLAMMQNLSGLMDMFGGESLLIEQKVARALGTWVGWSKAMGIACSGGKATMQYALRLAIARAEPESTRKGLSRRLVVIGSASAHYSLEHVATIVGIGADNCIRVPVDERGAMASSELWAAMERAHASGATIAAVVCCGGTIVDFACDDTREVLGIVERYTRIHSLPQRPYLHADAVIGWLYLSFRGVRSEILEAAIADARIRRRIVEVNERFAALRHFDSMGVDFHKTGLCPETNSFLVSPDRRFMDELGTGDYRYTDADFEFGNFRTYRYTFENSRPTHGTLAAWVNLRGLGRDGYREYLLSLHRGREGLEAAIERDGHFTVLNRFSLGWDVLFHIPLETNAQESYKDAAIAFMEHCWRRVREGYEVPLFSIVPEYHVDHDPFRSKAVFLLYPMHDRAPVVWDAVVAAIAREVRLFEQGRRVGRSNAGAKAWEKPIR